jgi:hypothetical protein
MQSWFFWKSFIASYGSRRWDDENLILPIVLMSAASAAGGRTISHVFAGMLTDDRLSAHKRLLAKLFP